MQKDRPRALGWQCEFRWNERRAPGFKGSKVGRVRSVLALSLSHLAPLGGAIFLGAARRVPTGQTYRPFLGLSEHSRRFSARHFLRFQSRKSAVQAEPAIATPASTGLCISYRRCRSRARPGARGAFRPKLCPHPQWHCSCGEVPPSSQSCPFADFGTSPSELVSFGMKAPRDSSRELKRLEEATRRDSRHFVQCPKCREWLDLRELGKSDSSWVSSWWMCIVLGLFGSIVMLIWAALD